MRDSDRYHIEERHEGELTLYVDDKPVVVVKTIHDVRQCCWQVYGPADLDRSIVLMKGFLHLLMLLGDEERVYRGAPEFKVPADREGVEDESEEEPRGASPDGSRRRQGQGRSVQGSRQGRKVRRGAGRR